MEAHDTRRSIVLERAELSGVQPVVCADELFQPVGGDELLTVACVFDDEETPGWGHQLVVGHAWMDGDRGGAACGVLHEACTWLSPPLLE